MPKKATCCDGNCGPIHQGASPAFTCCQNLGRFGALPFATLAMFLSLILFIVGAATEGEYTSSGFGWGAMWICTWPIIGYGILETIVVFGVTFLAAILSILALVVCLLTCFRCDGGCQCGEDASCVRREKEEFIDNKFPCLFTVVIVSLVLVCGSTLLWFLFFISWIGAGCS